MDRREDLIRLVDRQSPRRWTLVDAISGRTVRISALDWKRIGQSEQVLHDAGDRELAAQALAGGLMRQRFTGPKSRWYSPLNLLAFRVPLLNVDSIAQELAPRASFLFSPLAICGWLALIGVAMLSLLIGWSTVQESAQAVYFATNSATTLGYTLGGFFILTKAIHELAHAIACRRLGAAVGDCGLFFFCGMPCPYVDVSRIMQLDSKCARAAVMLAGVYAELILAAIATIIWWSTPPGTLHLLAANLILVCGISTVVFNANPLMRMDGYFVLSDLMGTPNLRRQAALAWRSLVAYRVVGVSSQVACVTFQRTFLSLYHVVASLYRWSVGGLILAFFFAIFREWNLWWMGVAMLGLTVAFVLYQRAKGSISMLRGKGVWSGAPAWRRLCVGLAMPVLFGLVLIYPIRREVSGKGVVDAADVTNVYIPESSWVKTVTKEFGEQVQLSELLVALRDEQLAVQLVGMRIRSKLASLESTHLKRQSLQNTSSDVAWQVDQASREWVESQYRSLVSRQERLQLVAPQAGILLPPLDVQAHLKSTSGHDASPRRGDATPLHDLEGTFVEAKTVWCRVGSPVHRCVCIPVTAEDRQHLRVGDTATLVIDDGVMTRVNSVVDRIDELAPQEMRDGDCRFVARCELPSDERLRRPIIGTVVEARIEFDREPLWRYLGRMVSQTLASP